MPGSVRGTSGVNGMCAVASAARMGEGARQRERGQDGHASSSHPPPPFPLLFVRRPPHEGPLSCCCAEAAAAVLGWAQCGLPRREREKGRSWRWLLPRRRDWHRPASQHSSLSLYQSFSSFVARLGAEGEHARASVHQPVLRCCGVSRRRAPAATERREMPRWPQVRTACHWD